MSKYDVIIIGAGPGGIFAAYELMQKAPELKWQFLKREIRWKKENVRLMAKR